MKKLGFSRYALSAGLSIALLVGCSGSPTSNPTSEGSVYDKSLEGAAAHILARRDSNPNVLYVAGNNEIGIFPLHRNEPQLGTINAGIDGPHGLYVDSSNTLYVANSDNSTVTVYPFGATYPSATYSQDLDGPQFPTVDNNGDLFVSNLNGTVVEYPPGSTYPSQVLYMPNNPKGYAAHGIAVDQQGNLYVTYQTDATNYNDPIAEFAAGSTQGVDLGIVLHRAEGLFVDNSGNIIGETPEGNVNLLEVFPPGATSPSVTIQFADRSRPTQVAMQQDEQKLYVSAGLENVFAGPYPLTGTRPPKFDTISSGVSGIAVTSVK
ncbi:MAG: hypothetical protein WCC84_12865 [Candidatus Cybelea sp.]